MFGVMGSSGGCECISCDLVATLPEHTYGNGMRQGFRVTKTQKIKVSTKKKAGRSPKSGSITAMSDYNHVHEVQSICFNLIFG